MAELELDLRGLKCPLPAMKTRKALDRLAPGQELTIVATDPMAAIDIPHLCHEDGHALLHQARVGERELTFRIRKGGARPPRAGTDAQP